MGDAVKKHTKQSAPPPPIELEIPGGPLVKRAHKLAREQKRFAVGGEYHENLKEAVSLLANREHQKVFPFLEWLAIALDPTNIPGATGVFYWKTEQIPELLDFACSKAIQKQFKKAVTEKPDTIDNEDFVALSRAWRNKSSVLPHEQYKTFRKIWENEHYVCVEVPPHDLDQEAAAMGHCAGSYKYGVMADLKRIYSVRSKKSGVPHITIEKRNSGVAQARGRSNGILTPRYARIFLQLVRDLKWLVYPDVLWRIYPFSLEELGNAIREEFLPDGPYQSKWIVLIDNLKAKMVSIIKKAIKDGLTDAAPSPEQLGQMVFAAYAPYLDTIERFQDPIGFLRHLDEQGAHGITGIYDTHPKILTGLKLGDSHPVIEKIEKNEIYLGDNEVAKKKYSAQILAAVVRNYNNLKPPVPDATVMRRAINLHKYLISGFVPDSSGELKLYHFACYLRKHLLSAPDSTYDARETDCIEYYRQIILRYLANYTRNHFLLLSIYFEGDPTTRDVVMESKIYPDTGWHPYVITDTRKHWPKSMEAYIPGQGPQTLWSPKNFLSEAKNSDFTQILKWKGCPEWFPVVNPEVLGALGRRVDMTNPDLHDSVLRLYNHVAYVVSYNENVLLDLAKNPTLPWNPDLRRELMKCPYDTTREAAKKATKKSAKKKTKKKTAKKKTTKKVTSETAAETTEKKKKITKKAAAKKKR